MEKPQILLVGIVAIAIAFFALRFTSRSDSEDLFDTPGEQLAMSRGLGDGASGEALGGSSARSVSGRPHEVQRGGAGRGAAAGGGDGRGGDRAGGSSATTLAAGSRERRAAAGSGGGSAAAARERMEGGLAALGRQGRVSDAEGGAKADRLELLSGKEKNVDPFYEGAVDENPDDDVVLEVQNVDDADQKAKDAVNVEEGEDGVGLEIGEDSVLTFPNAGNVNSEQGSIALDITPAWSGSDPTDNSFMQLRTQNEWNNRMQLVKNGPFLRFILTDNTGQEADISYRIDHWEQGESYKVTATYGNGETTLYVNGQRVGSNRYTGQFTIPPETPLYFGSDLPDGSYKGANAKLTAKVYNRALGAEEIF